ncbi:MAG: hypothetical protein IMW96_10390 [Thermoanaerobacteraceae bacterium]|nr:hypothetical protein [Thermoanaerobacteraceae bacterium]
MRAWRMILRRGRAVSWTAWLLLAGLLAVLAVPGHSGAAPAADFLHPLALEEVEQVSFSRADHNFRPLYPDLPEDQVKVAGLLEAYNRALSSLGPEGSLDDVSAGLFFLPRVHISLSGGDSVTIVLHNGVHVYRGDWRNSRRVEEGEVSRKLEEGAASLFVPAEGVRVEPTRARLGQEVTVSSDCAFGAKADILLMPSYWPVTIPSAPYPYPVPEAILLATVPVNHGRFSYTFTLAAELGRRLDGSPGKLGPGAWELMVRSGSDFMVPFTILPPQQPEPQAVVYDRGRIWTWTPQEGLRAGELADPADQPLLIGDVRYGTPFTHVSLPFLSAWLDVPQAEVEPGRFRLGPPDLGMTVVAGEDHAKLNGTMLQLDWGYLMESGGRMRLPWLSLAYFFGYRTQWLGPETAVFLRGIETIPPEVKAVIPDVEPALAGGRRVTVTLNGKPLPLGDQAYLDPTRGRVMVPLRATVEALGGKVIWSRLDPDFMGTASQHNYGLPPTAGTVDSYADVSLDGRMWRLYLPAGNGTTVVPLRNLALALDLRLTWNGSTATAELRSERLIISAPGPVPR